MQLIVDRLIFMVNIDYALEGGHLILTIFGK